MSDYGKYYLKITNLNLTFNHYVLNSYKKQKNTEDKNK